LSERHHPLEAHEPYSATLSMFSQPAANRRAQGSERRTRRTLFLQSRIEIRSETATTLSDRWQMEFLRLGDPRRDPIRRTRVSMREMLRMALSQSPEQSRSLYLHTRELHPSDPVLSALESVFHSLKAHTRVALIGRLSDGFAGLPLQPP